MKSIMLYFLMVCVPIMGIVGIIYAGQGIKPPVSVGGEWQIDKGFSEQSCIKTLRLSQSPKLKISQSGLYLNVQLDESTAILNGSISGNSIISQADKFIKTSPPANNCENYGAIAITATLIKEPGQQRLIGTVQINDCQNCPPVQFTAVRMPAAKQ